MFSRRSAHYESHIPTSNELTLPCTSAPSFRRFRDAGKYFRRVLFRRHCINDPEYLTWLISNERSFNAQRCYCLPFECRNPERTLRKGASHGAQRITQGLVHLLPWVTRDIVCLTFYSNGNFCPATTQCGKCFHSPKVKCTANQND
jgi:hypothetical protein